MGLARIALLASGDYACNLYWQSVTFFLLFFYTDAVGLPPTAAGAVFALGSMVDGAADMIVGGWAERVGRYRGFIRIGALPLGIAFCVLFLAPPSALTGRVALVLAAHVAFRFLYAAVNIPYAALSARVTDDSRERAWIAAGRMLFGAAAALTVALVVRRFALDAHGSFAAPGGYIAAAAGFAAGGTVLLLIVAAFVPTERDGAMPRQQRSYAAHLGTLGGNRAFVTLILASAIVAIGGGTLNGSVVYYFAYVAHQPLAAPVAVAWMGGVGAAAVPGWALIRDRWGTRALWLGNAAVALVLVAAFAWLGDRGAIAATVYLTCMQVVMVGFSFAFWAMLPDTVEWGEHRTGVRVEALAFGAAALAQKLALGFASLLMGAIFESAGYAPGAVQQPAMALAIRVTLLVVPAVAVAGSALAILANPLRHHTHDELTAELAARR